LDEQGYRQNLVPEVLDERQRGGYLATCGASRIPEKDKVVGARVCNRRTYGLQKDANESGEAVVLGGLVERRPRLLPKLRRWARDARMVEGIFQIMGGMEPPLITLDVMEVAAVRYPDVDRETLRFIIMTVLMSQRRCVVHLTRARLRLGPRTDREGNAFVELDLDFADRYSSSH